VLRDHRNAPIPDSLKALFTLIEKVALTSHEVTAEDTEAARRAGNSDEAIYDAITVCSLFKFYNTWTDGCGVERLTPEGYAASGKRLSQNGYVTRSAQ